MLFCCFDVPILRLFAHRRTHPILTMKFQQKTGFLRGFGQTDRPQFIKVSDIYIYTRGAALAMLASSVSRRITARASRSAGASRRYNGSFWVCCAPVTILRQRSPMSEVDRFCSIRTLRLVVHAVVVHARSQRQLQN